MPTQKGLFLVVEGGDGTGKSTLLSSIEAFFKNKGRAVVRTREPGGTPLAETVRDLILAHQTSSGFEVDARTELLLYEAARSHHVAHVVEPALAEGKAVLCDRFTFSSLAYQGEGRGLGFPLVEKLNKIATGGLEPDLIILLDLSPEKAAQRVAARGEKNRLDAEPTAFHKRVRGAFLKAARKYRSRCIVLDAAASPDEIFQRLTAHKLWRTLWREPVKRKK